MHFDTPFTFSRRFLSSIFGSCLLLSGVLLALGVAPTQAQTPEEPTTLLEHLQETGQLEELPPAAREQLRQQAQTQAEAGVAPEATVPSNLENRVPTRSINEESWPREDLNFRPDALPEPAGDVNNDGTTDWIYRYANVADNRTSDLSARTDKTLLVFGDGDFSDRYFDELYFGDLRPVGNFVGEENADAVEITEDGNLRVFEGTDIGYQEVGLIPGVEEGNMQPPTDLDGSGFDDLVITSSTSTSFTIVFGAATLDEVEVEVFEPSPAVDDRYEYATGNITGEGSGGVVRLEGTFGDDPADPSLVRVFDAGGSVEQEFEPQASDGSPLGVDPFNASMALADIDGSGERELLLQTGEATLVYVLEDGTYNTTPLAYRGGIGPAGDLNGNGRADFVFEDEDGTPTVAFGPETLEDRLSADLSIGEDAEFASAVSFNPIDRRPLGDATGDGTDDLIVTVDLGDQFGPRLVEISGDSSVESETDFLFNAAAYEGDDVLAVKEIGDWTGDDSPDAALLINGPDGDRVEIYSGAPGAGAPDLTLTDETELSSRPLVASGDFTGNGDRNVAVSWTANPSRVDLFEAGSGSSPIASVTSEELGLGEEIGTFNIANLGDIDGNGQDALAVTRATSFGDVPKEVYVYLHGELSGDPDVTLDYGNDDDASDSVGGRMQALGDINDNGFDDFAIGDMQRLVNVDQGLAQGGIYVHFGNEDRDFDSGGENPADLIIEPEEGEELAEEEFSIMTFFPISMATGDLTGNDHLDLIVKPFSHQDVIAGEGIDALFVYEGGAEFDDTPDASAPLPAYLDPGADGEFAEFLVSEVTALPPEAGAVPQLLVGNRTGGGNALVLEASGAGEDLLEPATNLRGPDQQARLGAESNLINFSVGSSGIADYDEDGTITAMLPQAPFSPNFRGSPAYEYPLGEDPVGQPEPEAPVASESVAAEDGERAESADTGAGIEANLGGEVAGVSAAPAQEAVTVTFERFEPSPPVGAGTIGRRNVSEYRFEVEADRSVEAGTKVFFDAERLSGITDPERVQIVQRDLPGIGSFSEVPTTYDPEAGELEAEVDGLGEFAFASETEPLSFVPAEVTAEIERTFGAATGPGDYRLVAVPGAAGLELGETLDGAAGPDWRAVRDDGSDADFFEELGPGDALAAGEGVWLISSETWAVDQAFETVDLGEDFEATVPLASDEAGWSIVANPLDRDLDWRSVQARNETSQPIWRFDAEAGFEPADTMRSARSGEAYYFLDTEGREALALPYPEASAGDPPAATQPAGAEPLLALTAEPAAGEAPASTARLGLAERPAGAEALFAPPGDFEAVSLRIEPEKAEDRTARGGALLVERRAIGESEGATFDLALTARTDGPVELRASNLGAIEGQEAALVRPETGDRHDLRAEETIRVEPGGAEEPLQVAVGSAEYVDDVTGATAPEELALKPPYPNPAQSQVTVEYGLPEETAVRIAAYNALGQKVAVLEEGQQAAGTHELQWDTGRLSSGTFFLQLEAAGSTETEQVVIVR